MKITKFEVSDFQGFPGPAIYDFEFGTASNLLIYGENGSGKSSLFRAIREFFNLDSKARPFLEFRNLQQPEVTSGHVTVHFDDGAKQTWPFDDLRPVKVAPASQTALQVGCLDYQALLETNFSQKGATVNVFDIAVRHLVARLRVAVAGGGSEQIGKLTRHEGHGTTSIFSELRLRIENGLSASRVRQRQAYLQKLRTDSFCVSRG